jgi:hypothetical protein
MAVKWARFLERLPKIQMIVGLMAGIVSILGALYSMRSPSVSAPLLGELVAVVRENRSNKPVTDAMVEVLAPNDAVVTRLTSRPEGRARIPLREGDYRLVVSHPLLGRESRQIHVQPGRTAVFQIVLGQPPTQVVTKRAANSASPSSAKNVMSRSVDSVRRFFRDLAR